ncbi:J domain-containing protein [Halorubellus sp. PRR65]|uniref:J domain-containing protein n=1 Tax=Halorubellus sp. PRR65 TaxID=3098148 RepID=UPI002B25A93E|nr:J domain-containing protein [Halorubellus sp. PRR65]
MAVVDRRGCDGCGRSLPVEELVAVSLPGDEHAVCCPECREHAESVADDDPTAVARQRGECEGCGTTRPVDEFETVALPDDGTVAVCEDCREHAESMSRRTSVDGHRGDCSGCGERFDVNDMTAVELDDGTTVACCEECASYARAAARTTSDADAFGENADDNARDAERADADTERADSDADGAGEAGVPDADSDEEAVEAVDAADVEETALAETPSICDQCGDWVDVELFEVVTATDRVEEFCPPCKDRARRNGVVREVRMRRAEAYAILDVDPGRAEAVVRDAYLSRIKDVHPDREDGSREAFRRVQRAYERLTD